MKKKQPNQYNFKGMPIEYEAITPTEEGWDTRPLDVLEVAFANEAVRCGNVKQAFLYVYGDSLGLVEWDAYRITAEAIKLVRRPPVQALYVQLTEALTKRVQVNEVAHKALVGNLLAHCEASLYSAGRDGSKLNVQIIEQMTKLMEYQAKLYGFDKKDFTDSKFDINLNFEPNEPSDQDQPTTETD